MGRAVINRLISHRIAGPSAYQDVFRDSLQMKELSLLRQVVELSNSSCPIVTATDSSSIGSTGSVIDLGLPPGAAHPKAADPAAIASIALVKDQQRATCLQMDAHEGNYQEVGSMGTLAVRVVEMCTNLMAGEHTCYHSDHSLTRCLAHGVYASVYNIPCGGMQLNDVYIGMCMGTDSCDVEHHVTCHRWAADVTDPTLPVNIETPKNQSVAA